MLEKHIDVGQPDTHFSGIEQGFEVFDLLVNELKKTDALTGYHTDTHTPVHTADILYNILHICILKSGSPSRWPTKQACIKHPCTQDLSSSPTGLFRSFTASRALSWLHR